MNKWQRIATGCAGISGAIAVAMGAAASHWLQSSLAADALLRIEKAAQYQMYHSLVLLAIAALMHSYMCRSLKIAMVLMLIGIVCFSGSLYAYSFSGWHWLVFVTPLGGLAWIAGWLALSNTFFCCNAQKTLDSAPK
ncbi:MAG: DUF423 domain-containing protein [Alphaproteobacteria bacterium]|nr:DUF423 domain-containing protein [Alphaproteobacteria bacterium]